MFILSSLLILRQSKRSISIHSIFIISSLLFLLHSYHSKLFFCLLDVAKRIVYLPFIEHFRNIPFYHKHLAKSIRTRCPVVYIKLKWIAILIYVTILSTGLDTHYVLIFWISFKIGTYHRIVFFETVAHSWSITSNINFNLRWNGGKDECRFEHL